MKLLKPNAQRQFKTAHLLPCAQALPITQHDRVWTLYLEWAASFGVVETAVKVFRRYLMFDPQHREEYVDYLVKVSPLHLRLGLRWTQSQRMSSTLVVKSSLG